MSKKTITSLLIAVLFVFTAFWFFSNNSSTEEKTQEFSEEDPAVGAELSIDSLLANSAADTDIKLDEVVDKKFHIQNDKTVLAAYEQEFSSYNSPLSFIFVYETETNTSNYGSWVNPETEEAGATLVLGGTEAKNAFTNSLELQDFKKTRGLGDCVVERKYSYDESSGVFINYFKDEKTYSTYNGAGC